MRFVFLNLFRIRTSQVVSISEQNKKNFEAVQAESLHPTTHSFPKDQKVEVKVSYAVFIAQKDSTVRCCPLTAEAGFNSKPSRVRFVVDKDDLEFFHSTSVFPRLVSFN